MDHEDTLRTLSNKAKLLQLLQARGVITNEDARRVAWSRAMGRCHELIKAGEPITVRKLKGATWEIRYQQPALGSLRRDARGLSGCGLWAALSRSRGAGSLSTMMLPMLEKPARGNVRSRRFDRD